MGRDFKKLKIFHLGYSFLLEIYDVLPSLPDVEQRNMFDQLQRSATSIVLNIVEGASNKSNKVFANHLQYSYGSCREIDVLLMLALDLNYIDKGLYLLLNSKLEELKATIYRFMQSVEKEVMMGKVNYSLF